ncbi:MAG: type IV pili methyl-accepting chemotaxis transducer N-terminal domain-containing protein [Pseudomonadota bacterium]
MWKHRGRARHALAIGLAVAIAPGIGAAQTIASSSSEAIAPGVGPQIRTGEAGFVNDVSAGERVDYAGRLRMLSERVTAMICYNFADIGGMDAQTGLTVTAFEIEQILDALEFGDPALDIVGAETNTRVLARINQVRAVWEPMRQSIEATLESGIHSSVSYIYLQSSPFLEATIWLATEIEGVYSDPTALLQEDAMRINIAARQRMLLQRVSKTYCLTRSAIQSEDALAELDAAADLWGLSARALRYGMPEAGVNQTDDPGIIAALDDLLARWEVLSARIEEVRTVGGLNDVEVTQFITAIDTLTVRMNKIVVLYADASKLDL